MKIISAREAREISNSSTGYKAIIDSTLANIDQEIKAAAKKNKFLIEISVDFRVSSTILRALTEEGYKVSGLDRLVIRWDEREVPKGAEGTS